MSTILAGWMAAGLAAQAQPVRMERSDSGAPVLRWTASGPVSGVVFRSTDLVEWSPYYAFALLPANAGVPADLGSPGSWGYFRLETGPVTVPDGFVWIPPGAFRMGSPNAEFERVEDEGPVFEVSVPRGFWMGRTEVTVREYVELMGVNPSMSPDDSH